MRLRVCIMRYGEEIMGKVAQLEVNDKPKGLMGLF